MAAADQAGYAVQRYYDTGVDPATRRARNRWYVYGYDKTSGGQAYFFINPEAKRDIVIEAPHASWDLDTDEQGARIFVGLAARALILSGAHRCNSPEVSECGGATTKVCNAGVAGPYRRSDVVANLANTFHLLHRNYSFLPGARTKFVQPHGMQTDHEDVVQASDGSTATATGSSLSISARFVDALKEQVAGTTFGGSVMFSCQRDSLAGVVPADRLCATHNVQGRVTNISPIYLFCPPETATASGRFLHIEQELAFREADLTSRWVEAAVRDVWGACNMTSDPSDCALGPQQTNPTTLSCP